MLDLRDEIRSTEQHQAGLASEQHTQQMIEARKVVHVRMRDKDMREAHQLARWQHGDVAEVEQQCSPLVTKIDIQPRIAEYIID